MKFQWTPEPIILLDQVLITLDVSLTGPGARSLPPISSWPGSTDTGLTWITLLLTVEQSFHHSFDFPLPLSSTSSHCSTTSIIASDGSKQGSRKDSQASSQVDRGSNSKSPRLFARRDQRTEPGPCAAPTSSIRSCAAPTRRSIISSSLPDEEDDDDDDEL